MGQRAVKRRPERFEVAGGIVISRASSHVLLERSTTREAFVAHRETTHFTELVLGELVLWLDSRTIETFDVNE